MGLTINYDITFSGNRKDLQQKLEKIRQKCLDLPFYEVGEVETKKITQEAINVFHQLQAESFYPNNTTENLKRRDDILRARFNLDVWDFLAVNNKPSIIVDLFLLAGTGCEGTSLIFVRRGNKYKCSGFTKTQYAEKFVGSHFLIIHLFDMIKEMEEFKVDVRDEGEYWETRDLRILAKNINDYTGMLKSISGVLKDQDIQAESNIDKSENYIKINKD